MKRVISYSFFRSSASIYESEKWSKTKLGFQFCQFLPMIVRAHFCVWPSWELRVYHDDRVIDLPYFPALVELHKAKLINLIYNGACESICGATGMLARLKPAFDQDVEVVACRDVDSIPTPRERRCVEEFLSSVNSIHTIHDSREHSGLMGGTFATKAERFRQITKVSSVEELIGRYGLGIDFTKHGADQHLLNRMAVTVFPHNETMIHELDHNVGDMNATIVRKITVKPPKDIPPEVVEHGDAFAFAIGGCGEPMPPFMFYNRRDFPKNQEINECEARAGVDALEMMDRIAKL